MTIDKDVVSPDMEVETMADAADYGPGRLLGVKVFTKDGVYTRAPEVKKIKVIMTGGGASGRRADLQKNIIRGAGGGAGETRILLFPYLFDYDPIPVTVGKGGDIDAPIVSGNPNPQNGSPSVFGNITSAAGGVAGSLAGVGGFGGGVNSSYSQNRILIAGGDGDNGSIRDTGDNQSYLGGSGMGGASYWGGGSRSDAVSIRTRAFGSGGSGGHAAYASGNAYGKGANGIVIVEEYS